MSREITRRETLLDCLEYETLKLLLVSKDHKGLTPAEGHEDEFDEYMEKCRILRDTIQALESEPVRQVLAEWQIRLMKGEKPNNDDLLTPE